MPSAANLTQRKNLVIGTLTAYLGTGLILYLEFFVGEVKEIQSILVSIITFSAVLAYFAFVVVMVVKFWILECKSNLS